MFLDYLPAITAASIIDEVQAISNNLVNNSLSQYSAYTLKELEARAYLDSSTASPLLEAEAKLRGMTTKALSELIIEKARLMKSVVSNVEVIRIKVLKEFDAAPDKLAFRDSILKTIKGLL